MTQIDPAYSGAGRSMTSDAQCGVHARAASNVSLWILSGAILGSDANCSDRE